MWQYLPQAMLAIFVSYAIYRFFYPKRKMSKAGVTMGSATVVSGGTSQGSSIEKTPSMDEDSPKNGKKKQDKKAKERQGDTRETALPYQASRCRCRIFVGKAHGDGLFGVFGPYGSHHHG